ncbi:MAG: class I SAM-dependent methyltransferase [Methanobacteriaceae archaeon]|jgi:predicted RNA methylase|nr:class I SAM-dependent methyltransferase [Candidatus Methanorudis spinitermitis]
MIKISYDIKIYRKILGNVLNENDVVVELGSHIGKTSKLIAEKVENGKLICLDNSPEATTKMNNLKLVYPNLKFINGDVRLHEVLKQVTKIINKCDTLAIDLGGGYHPDTVFKVYYIWASTLKPKHTIIRNKGLVDFINTSVTCENIQSKEGWLESCGCEGIPPQIDEFKLWTSIIK